MVGFLWMEYTRIHRVHSRLSSNRFIISLINILHVPASHRSSAKSVHSMFRVLPSDSISFPTTSSSQQLPVLAVFYALTYPPRLTPVHGFLRSRKRVTAAPSRSPGSSFPAKMARQSAPPTRTRAASRHPPPSLSFPSPTPCILPLLHPPRSLTVRRRSRSDSASDLLAADVPTVRSASATPTESSDGPRRSSPRRAVTAAQAGTARTSPPARRPGGTCARPWLAASPALVQSGRR
jgi:hypothetical protein